MPDLEKTVPERYKAKYDNGKWIILDLWHPQIKNISDYTSDIPMDSPAVKTISEGELNAVIEKMAEMGWLEKIIKVKKSNDIINIDNSQIKEMVSNIIIAVRHLEREITGEKDTRKPRR